MEQKQLEKETEEQEYSPISDAIQGMERPADTKKTKTLQLLFKSCCGCGCSDIKIEREVPINSSLKDGDYVDNLKEDDVMV